MPGPGSTQPLGHIWKRNVRQRMYRWRRGAYMYLQTVGFQHIEKVLLADTFTLSEKRMVRERPPKVSHDCLFMGARHL